RVPFNCGTWTDVEHQGFLRGLEVYGYGNCDAIGIFVPSRSPLQIEAYAQWYFAEGEAVRHLHQGIHDNLGAPYYPSRGGGGPGREPSAGCGDGGGGGGGGGGSSSGGRNGAAARCLGVFGELSAAQEQPASHPASQQQQRTAHRPGIRAVPDPHLGPMFFGEQAWGEHFNLHDACFGVL
ncbi:unnamed protein product, partial [Ectocarpus sp. 8 AP-2014]